MENKEFIKKANDQLQVMQDEKSISAGIELANIFLEYLGVSGKTNSEDILLSSLELPNAERYDTWFQEHPHFKSTRACFRMNEKENALLETKLYALNKRSRTYISGAVHFTPNFEDADYTRQGEQYKVAIDFFLTPENDALIIALSNRKQLRVVEVGGELSNTQVEIFKLWENVAREARERQAIHQTLWDSFELKSVNKSFYKGIADHFTELVQYLVDEAGKEEEEAKLFTGRLHGRLLFCWFLKKKNFISNNHGYFDPTDKDTVVYYRNHLEPLFFEILNTPIEERKVKDDRTPYLNGGLFEEQQTDWRGDKELSFPQGYFVRLFNHFNQYNFTTDESTADYEQIAIDPEMLGRIFENLLAEMKEETGEQARKAKGAFYTPREIVDYMCRESLRNYLYTEVGDSGKAKKAIDALVDIPDSDWATQGTNSKRDYVPKKLRPKITTALDKMKVLDPAVGSGAFPIGMLHHILRIYERVEKRFDPYKTKLGVLENNIYGVDIEPTAIEIARLRGFLALVVDQEYNPNQNNGGVDTLPNLEFKFVTANTLIPLEKQAGLYDNLFPKHGNESDDKTLFQKMQEIKRDYFKSSASERNKLEVKYKKLFQGNLFASKQAKQLRTYNPFDMQSVADFYDARLMHDVDDNFDVVIGNPPYVSLEKIKEHKDEYKEIYDTASARGDLYVLFYERGVSLTKEGIGLLCYISSNKWMRAKYGKKLRGYFAEKNPLELIDFGGFKVFESATVDTNIVLIENSEGEQPLHACRVGDDFERDQNLREYFLKNSVELDELSKDVWFIGTKAEMKLKKKIEEVGTPLKDWDVEIKYGIKTGYNKAFIIDQEKRDELVEKDPKSAEIIKPLLKGKDIKRYGYEFKNRYLINAHNGYTNSDGEEVPRIEVEDYPAIKEHLDQYWDKIKDRYDQGETPYNLRNCAYLEKFDEKKIMWKEMTSRNSFCIDENGFFCNDTVRLMTGTDLIYLLGVFNSRLFHYCFENFYAGGGLGSGVRYKHTFMQNVPIPKKVSFREEIEGLVMKVIQNVENSDLAKKHQTQLEHLIYNAYDLTKEEIEIIEEKSA
jgi:hypothetical protein